MRAELYRLTMGDAVWTLTSAQMAIVYNGETYVPTAIARGQLESSNELARANIEVRLDLWHALARLLLKTNQEQVLGLTLFIQTAAGTETGWKGRLASLKHADTSMTLSFESVFTSLRRPGLRARFQKSCRHALYGRGCTLNPELFYTQGQVTAVAGLVLTVPEAAAIAAGSLLGGMARDSDGMLSLIVGQAGTAITLQRPLNSIPQAIVDGGYGNAYGVRYGGCGVKLYPGCDHSRAACKTKFNNLPNYGGFDWIPIINPMGGSPII